MTRILYVEDDDDDIFLLKRVLDQAPMDVDLEVRPNGREALDYLAQFSSAADPACRSWCCSI